MALSFSTGFVFGSTGKRGVLRDATALNVKIKWLTWEEKFAFLCTVRNRHQTKPTLMTLLNHLVNDSLWNAIPHSLGMELGHVPHQRTAPVVTHQSHLWDALRSGKTKLYTRPCNIMITLQAAAFHKEMAWHGNHISVQNQKKSQK